MSTPQNKEENLKVIEESIQLEYKKIEPKTDSDLVGQNVVRRAIQFVFIGFILMSLIAMIPKIIDFIY